MTERKEGERRRRAEFYGLAQMKRSQHGREEGGEKKKQEGCGLGALSHPQRKSDGRRKRRKKEAGMVLFYERAKRPRSSMHQGTLIARRRTGRKAISTGDV